MGEHPEPLHKGDQTPDIRFASRGPTDGREPGDWKTRYPEKEARRAICFEAIYGTFWFLLCPAALFLLWFKSFKPPFGLTPEQYSVPMKYLCAWLGGLLGGSLFTLKMLYHNVAWWNWNIDRRFWRLLVPHLSAGLAFAFVCIMQSGIIAIFEPQFLERYSVVIAISFLVGYFSDSALAKLAKVAYSLFGTPGEPGKSTVDGGRSKS